MMGIPSRSISSSSSALSSPESISLSCSLVILPFKCLVVHKLFLATYVFETSGCGWPLSSSFKLLLEIRILSFPWIDLHIWSNNVNDQTALETNKYIILSTFNKLFHRRLGSSGSI